MVSLNGTSSANPFLWFCVAVMSIFMGFFLRDMAHRMLSIGKKTAPPEWIKNGSPFIGSPGFNTGLSVQLNGDTILIRTGIFTSLYVIIGLFLVGPGALLMIGLRLDHFHKDLPLPVDILLGMALLIATCLFISNFAEFVWHRHYAEITPDSVRMCRGKDEDARIALKDIRDVEIAVSSVLSGSVNRTPTDNYSLQILAQDATVYVLCISDKKDRIESLKTELEQRIKARQS